MLIGIVGKAQAGKDTIADTMKGAFLKQHKINFELIAFADYLKELCGKYFGLTHEELYGDQKETFIVERPRAHGQCGYWNPRGIMQFVGESVREIDYNFWVKEVDKRITDYENVIITDVRHMNEFSYVKENNGYLLNIKRESNKEIRTSGHISEIALDEVLDSEYDFIIVNSGTIDELKIIVGSTVDMIIKLEILKETWGG